MALEGLSSWICTALSSELPPRTPQGPLRSPRQPLKEVPEAGRKLHAFMSGPYAQLLQATSPGRLGSDPAAAPSHWEPAALCRVLEVLILHALIPKQYQKPALGACSGKLVLA